MPHCFASANRNKLSVALDLKSPEGRAIARRRTAGRSCGHALFAGLPLAWPVAEISPQPTRRIHHTRAPYGRVQSLNKQ
jgi:hypothetical protein